MNEVVTTGSKAKKESFIDEYLKQKSHMSAVGPGSYSLTKRTEVVPITTSSSINAGPITSPSKMKQPYSGKVLVPYSQSSDQNSYPTVWKSSTDKIDKERGGRYRQNSAYVDESADSNASFARSYLPSFKEPSLTRVTFDIGESSPLAVKKCSLTATMKHGKRSTSPGVTSMS